MAQLKEDPSSDSKFCVDSIMANSTYLPLRWESSGDEWWFASPIDCAAANGHYDLVKHLLETDPDLLIKLTSLPRIQKLETLWEDDDSFSATAKCRSDIAQKLLQDYETEGKSHILLNRGSGYGAWLLYTAASAGNFLFVKELVDKDPVLVFGEGGYGVTDILYAAAKGKSGEVFRFLFECCLSSKGKEVFLDFKSEMMNRAVHAAARGGNVEILKELLVEGCDVLSYRDSKGSTILHSASSNGRVEVVEYLISSHETIKSVDKEGNTALHVAAYSGHLAVIKALLTASPKSASLTNNYGDTFIHMAVAGFRPPSHRRFDQQIELMKELATHKLVNIEELVDVQNNDGRTAIHVALIENIQSDLVELLLSVRYMTNLNARDNDGNTPLDLLKHSPESASSNILIKRLISAGALNNFEVREIKITKSRVIGVEGSIGTLFNIPDSEMFLHSGVEDVFPSNQDFSSTDYGFSCEIKRVDSVNKSCSPKSNKPVGPWNRLKKLLNFRGKKARRANLSDLDDIRSCVSSENNVVSLRKQFSRVSSLPNDRRIVSLRCSTASRFGPTSNELSESSADGKKIAEVKVKRKKHGSLDLGLMNNYFCFGSHGLAVQDSLKLLQKTQNQRSLAV